MMKFVYTIALLILTFADSAKAQVYFNKLYDYDGSNSTSNHATSCIELSNGDFLIGGNKFLPSFGALHFLRINSNGDTVLTKSYPKPGCGYYTATGNSLIKCYDGNYVQAGAYTDSGSTSLDALLIKLTENGDTLWTRTYGGANFDNANVVCQTLDSGFVMMGVTQSYSAGAASDFYLIKTDKNGVFQWQKVYGTTLPEDCLSGQITLDGGFILAGHKNNQLHIVKTDGNGNFQWEKTYPGTAGQAFVKQLADSTYILVGAKSVAGLGYQAYMAKLTKSGTITWSKTYGGSGDQQFYSMPIILNDGSIVSSGVSTLADPWGLLIKTDSSGNQQWLRTFYANSFNANYVYDLKLTSNNEFIMVGSGNVTGQDAWVIMVDSAGCEIANCNVGIEEFESSDSKLHVFPNPASSEITLSIEGEELNGYEITITDILGKQQKMNGDHSKIPVSQLTSGVYIISAKRMDGKKYFSEKFLKQ
ncbi:MAG TPA: T9SS type A sorting domain-containing protein [Bacteroidia bacterium]|jgi:hypothetical protein